MWNNRYALTMVLKLAGLDEFGRIYTWRNFKVYRNIIKRYIYFGAKIFVTNGHRNLHEVYVKFVKWKK